MNPINYKQLYREEKRRLVEEEARQIDIKNGNNNINNIKERQHHPIILQEKQEENENEEQTEWIVPLWTYNEKNDDTKTNQHHNYGDYLSSSFNIEEFRMQKTFHQQDTNITRPIPTTTSLHASHQKYDDDVVNDTNDKASLLINHYHNSSGNSIPSSIYYYCPPDGIISLQYTKELVHWLQNLAFNNDNNNPDHANGKWTPLLHSKRRVALFDIANTPLLSFPEPLQYIVNILMKMNIFDDVAPNHILINEYTIDNGTIGIMPHTDGPIYYPKTATISIGSTILFHFNKRKYHDSNMKGQQHQQDDDTTTLPITTMSSSLSMLDHFQVLLSGNPSSLIVFTDDAYTNYLHSINDNTNEEIEYTDETCLNSPSGIPICIRTINDEKDSDNDDGVDHCNDEFYRISLTFRIKKNVS